MSFIVGRFTQMVFRLADHIALENLGKLAQLQLWSTWGEQCTLVIWAKRFLLLSLSSWSEMRIALSGCSAVVPHDAAAPLLIVIGASPA